MADTNIFQAQHVNQFEIRALCLLIDLNLQ